MHTRSERHEDRIVTTVEISPEEVTVHQTPFGVVVDVPGLTTSGQPGAPALPHTHVRVGVPQDTWPTELELDEGEWVTIAKGVVVPIAEPQAGMPPKGRGKGDPHEPGRGKRDPHQPGHCADDCDCRADHGSRHEDEGPLVEGFPPPLPVVPDPEAYRRAVEEPPPVAAAAAVEPMPALRAAAVELSPVRQTKDGAIELCTSFRVSVRFSSEPEVADREETAKLLADELGREIDPERLQLLPDGPREVTALDLELAREWVVNPEIFDDIRVIDALPSEYLIITDDRTWDAAQMEPVGDRPGLVEAFEELAALKRARGVSARVVTVGDILAGQYGDYRNGSRDLQEVIRRFLKANRNRWGVRWLLVGGDVETVPTRTVAGGCRGTIDTTSTNPPEDNRSFWTGGHLRMNAASAGEWWGASVDNLLTRPDTGRLIPYDGAGTSSATRPGWFFTDSTYTMRQTTPSQYVRVNGPDWLVNTRLQWHYHWNQLPTDFYYSSLQSWYVGTRTVEILWFRFQIPWVYEPDHDWDVRENGIYGQCTDGGRDLDGVHLSTEISVGRVPVDTADEARAYVAKVAAYEGLDGLIGPSVDQFSGSMLLAASNWGGPQQITATLDSVPAVRRYSARSDHSLLQVQTVPDSWKYDLVSHISDSDRRVLPMKSSSNPGTRGWYYARSETDLRVAETDLFFFTLPHRTPWIVVHGSQLERRPAAFHLDWGGQDGSMADQETLRRQVDVGLPGITSFRRTYEDEHDLTWVERLLGGPVRYLTSSVLREELERSPALVSLSGHGSGDGCCGGSVGLARSLTNGPLCFVGYADSCLTSEFDRDDAFGEALVTNPVGGAVGYVSNSRFSWIGIGDDYQRAFFHRLTTTRHLGRLNDTKVAVAAANSPNAYWRWPVFTLNLLGDPELRVRRQARRPLVLEISDDFAKLRVTDVEARTPVPGARVRVSAGRSVAELVSDAEGWVNLPSKGFAQRTVRRGVSVEVEHEDYEPARTELAAAD